MGNLLCSEVKRVNQNAIPSGVCCRNDFAMMRGTVRCDVWERQQSALSTQPAQQFGVVLTGILPQQGLQETKEARIQEPAPPPVSPG
jgi:hypothetical protein